MSGEYIPDLAVEVLADGNVRLCQQAGCGEDAVIDLHPIQVRHLAERLGLLPAGASDGGTAARRLRIVTDKLTELAAEMYFRDEIVARCSGGLMFYSVLDGLADLAVEFCNDIEGPAKTNMQRRLQRIAEDAGDLCHLLGAIPSIGSHDEEDEDVRRARRLTEDIRLLLEDITEGGECHDKSAAISVTRPAISVTSPSPDAPKRGRPASGMAMSDAERQARRRGKQQGQQEDMLLTQQEGENDGH